MIYGKIGKRYEDATIENYRCPPGCEEARKACEALIAGSTEGLLLLGPCLLYTSPSPRDRS